MTKKSGMTIVFKDKTKAGGKWEHLAPYELVYAKKDVTEAATLAEALHDKFLASLTPEQYAMFAARNSARAMEIDFFPPKPEDPADVDWKYQYWTLTKVRNLLTEVKVALLGFDPGKAMLDRAAATKVGEKVAAR